MLYFPIFRFSLPDWLPFFGGKSYLFFSPVFNFADAAITCGTIYMMLFHFKELTNFTDLCSDKIKEVFYKLTGKKDESQNEKNDEDVKQ